MKGVPRPHSAGTRKALLASLCLALLPAALLFKALFGGQDYVPFDLTIFPPASIALDAGELARRKAGGNFDVTEKTLLCAPEYRLARQEIVEGRFPHWNPWVRGGAPLFANALDGFAYPVHWLFFLFSPERAFGLAAWIAFALAGVFMFGFLREIGLEALPALFGAIVFQLSGTLAANGHFFMRMETLIWLPAGFWALERVFKQVGARRIPPFCAFATSLGLCWLAGFPPYALACSLAFGLYMLAATFRSWRDRGARAAAAFAGWSAGAVAVGLGVAFVQLAPMLDYFPEAQRDLRQGTAELSAQGLDPLGLLGLLMPAPFGHPTSSEALPYANNPLVYLLWSRAHPETGHLHYPANFNYTEYAIYLGALPLVCALLAMFRGSARFRHFALPAFVFFLAFATGGVLFQSLAGLQVFQSTPPVRYAGVACFFGAALAAMGLEIGPHALSKVKHGIALGLTLLLSGACFWMWAWASGLAADPDRALDWMTETIRTRWLESYPEVASQPALVRGFFGPWVVPALQSFASQALYGGIAFLVATAWVLLQPFRGAGARARPIARVLAVAAVAVSAGELAYHAATVNPTFPHRDPSETPIHRFLRDQRVARRAAGGFTVARVAGAVREPSDLPPNLLIPEHIRDLNCYAFVDGRSSRPFVRLYGPDQMIRKYWLKALPADERLRLGLFDLFGVRYLLTTDELPGLGPPAVPPFEGPGGRFFVYERKSALPRAFLVPAAEPVPSDEAAVERITSREFDPRDKVLLHDVDPADSLPRLDDPSRLDGASVVFEVDEPTRVRLRVTGSPGTWLVLADTAMSHWNATLNGDAVPWRRADLCFRALWVPPGEHVVRFAYDARPFRRGLWTTAGAIGLMLLLLLWWNGHPQRRDPDVVSAGA